MHDNQLRSAVDRFSNLVVDLPDNELERQWIWGSYESEGVRFVFSAPMNSCGSWQSRSVMRAD